MYGANVRQDLPDTVVVPVSLSTTDWGTPAVSASFAISSSDRPWEFSAGWLANSAVLNAENLSGAWSATTATALAARVEYSVPDDRPSRIETGWYSTVTPPAARSVASSASLAVSNWWQYGHM